MKIVNWAEIEENTSTMLEPGGYVCKITAVVDDPIKECLKIMYDVAEGPCAGIYEGMGVADDWKHCFYRSYKDKARNMFKAYLNRLEESNRGRFSVAQWQVYSNEQQFVGLEIGLVFGKELYTNNHGEDKERTVVVAVKASQDIRNGDFTVPEPKNLRTTIPAPSGNTEVYNDLPFGV